MKLLQEHNRTFINWFNETIISDDNASKTLRLLAIGPNLNVPTWKGYDINNYSFYTKSQDDKSSVQNSGSLWRLIPNTFLVHQITTQFKPQCLTSKLLKKSRSLIIINSKCLYLNVNRLMEIPVFIEIKWDSL